MQTESDVLGSSMYISAKDLCSITRYSRSGLSKILSRNNLNFVGSEKKRYYSIDEIKEKGIFNKYFVEIEKHSIPKDQIKTIEKPTKDINGKGNLKKIEKDIKEKNINKESDNNPMKFTKKSDSNDNVVDEENTEYSTDDKDPFAVTKNQKEPENSGSEQEFTSIEQQALANQYNIALKDVIGYLNSLEGRKNQKYEQAKEHFDRLRLEQENQQLRSFASMKITPMPVLSPNDNHKKSDDNGYDSDIKYQREVASAWGPFLMMKNLNPDQDANGVKKEIEELKESNKELKNLLYSVLSGNQGKTKDEDPIDSMTKFLGLFKGIKDVLSESESERKAKLEEETKQRQIEANKEKVSKLIEAIQNYSPNPEPEPTPSVPVYRNNQDISGRTLNKKFKDKFSKKF